MIATIRERIVGWTGSISGVASILGSWQVCHNVCLVLISLLSIVGITVVGMPLEFLTRIALPLWSVAALLFGVTLWMYLSKHCISRALLLTNFGLIIAGVPFAFLQTFILWFWIAGGVVATSGVVLFISEKFFLQRRCHP